jgi:hypothetical protein
MTINPQFQPVSTEFEVLATRRTRSSLNGCREPSWLENIRFRIEKAMIRENIELEYSHV